MFQKLKEALKRIPLLWEVIQIRDALLRVLQEINQLRVLLAKRELEHLLQGERYRDPRRLHLFEFQVNSQNGEDGIIHEIFNRIGRTNRIFVEIGVGDGGENNTAFLLSMGWSGYWIDGLESAGRHLSNRKDIPAGTISFLQRMVTRENIEFIFKELRVPKEFDLLSIDIDQNTYYIWEALGSFRPRVVVIEYNANLPASIDWKVNYSSARSHDGSKNFGASLKALEILGAKFGYALVGCDRNGCNAFFVKNDCVGDLFLAPFTSENHYEKLKYECVVNEGHGKSILDRPI